ncbi:hypothetical protein C1634_011080 [Chryseobacterium viscerum]|uniref:Uncharacterized protein n=1 Tax=Chryseobacterium viscerum TaxID=1037377 RepID=A0A316WK50_9FLAO|nr:hypothetical protein C1634_011080 [Chryseobacterium viscerum]
MDEVIKFFTYVSRGGKREEGGWKLLSVININSRYNVKLLLNRDSFFRPPILPFSQLQASGLLNRNSTALSTKNATFVKITKLCTRKLY